MCGQSCVGIVVAVVLLLYSAPEPVLLVVGSYGLCRPFYCTPCRFHAMCSCLVGSAVAPLASPLHSMPFLWPCWFVVISCLVVSEVAVPAILLHSMPFLCHADLL